MSIWGEKEKSERLSSEHALGRKNSMNRRRTRNPKSERSGFLSTFEDGAEKTRDLERGRGGLAEGIYTKRRFDAGKKEKRV